MNRSILARFDRDGETRICQSIAENSRMLAISSSMDGRPALRDKTEKTMANPFNPLEWIRSAQDWFAKTERSSGFRPFLIFIFICYGMGFGLLTSFNDLAIKYVALGIISLSTLSFIILYFIKSFTDPDFCRSESHIERMRQIDREPLGSDIKQIDARAMDYQETTRPESERPLLDTPSEQEGDK